MTYRLFSPGSHGLYVVDLDTKMLGPDQLRVFYQDDDRLVERSFQWCGQWCCLQAGRNICQILWLSRKRGREEIHFDLFIPWAKQNPLTRTPPVRVWSTATDSVRTLPIKVCISWPMALCNAADRVVCIGGGVAVPLIHHNPIAAFTTRCADIVDDATRILNGGGTNMVLQGY